MKVKKCSRCKKNQVIGDSELCFECICEDVLVKQDSHKYDCPNCKRDTKRVFEYSTNDFDHRKVFDDYTNYHYTDFDILKEYFTCLECDKQFVVTTEEERK